MADPVSRSKYSLAVAVGPHKWRETYYGPELAAEDAAARLAMLVKARRELGAASVEAFSWQRVDDEPNASSATQENEP
jgi:hypothetical protein